MGLPPKVFYSLIEAAARWNCSPADIAGWASLGQLRIVTGISPVQAGGEMIAGLVEISAADMLWMFRRCGTEPIEGHARRVRPVTEDAERPWVFVTDPVDGVPIEIATLMIFTSDAQRFEEEHEIFGRPRISNASAQPKYDWEGFWQHLVVRIYREGLPDTQEELVTEMQDFFERRAEHGATPDGRTLRRRIKPVWYELRGHA